MLVHEQLRARVVDGRPALAQEQLSTAEAFPNLPHLLRTDVHSTPYTNLSTYRRVAQWTLLVLFSHLSTTLLEQTVARSLDCQLIIPVGPIGTARPCSTTCTPLQKERGNSLLCIELTST
jgi:hypothetical protein